MVIVLLMLDALDNCEVVFVSRRYVENTSIDLQLVINMIKWQHF